MLKLVIFDFDGVIADSEPAHFEMFRRILGEGGLDLTWQQYTENYLGFDDFNAFTQILKSRDLPHSPEFVSQLCRRKEEKFAKYLQDKSVIFPGAKDLLLDLAEHQVTCSIYSGAIRSEIEFILSQANLSSFFTTIVSVEDVQNPKPHPEGYSMTLEKTNQLLKNNSQNHPILPGESLVIEDSGWGITSAKQANMFCLAVEQTYPASYLNDADRIVKDLTQVNTDLLRQFVERKDA